MVNMPADEEYFTITEAKRRAGMKSDDALYRAMKNGRLKTVTKMVGPRVVRLTTQAWLDAFLASRNVSPQGQDEMTP
jgi:hypothetical protein